MGDAGWQELLEGFRALGGTAENLRLDTGERGRGLFASDTSRPARLRVPENLLLPIEDVSFANDKMTVAPSAKMGGKERAWFEHYANAYTWGAGGRAEAEDFLGQCLALPDHLRETLINSFGMTFCSARPSPAAAQERFLDSRVITYKGRRVVMPMVELVNHDDRFPGYDCTKGVTVGGKFDSEVLVDYGGRDPFGLFQAWGFASEAKLAMSLSMTIPLNSGEIRIMRQLDDHHALEIGGGKGSVLVPAAKSGNNGIDLSYLMLGARGFPRMPKGVFHRAVRDAGRSLPDEVFELIQFRNRQLFLDLLKDLETVEGTMARALRTMCRLQLDALSQCYGMRPI